LFYKALVEGSYCEDKCGFNLAPDSNNSDEENYKKNDKNDFMKEDILLKIDNQCQPENLYQAYNPTFKRQLKLCIPNSNSTYHTTDIRPRSV
jgi:hypothetical protein